ncbi:MAG: cyanophycinase [Candidatus Sericytochromatia bacterium]
MIIGGGTIPAAIIQRIISLAGGPEARIVIFPHASEIPVEAAESTVSQFVTQGARHAEVYACKAGAMDAEPCRRQLVQAGGIFFTGGDQNQLTKALAGTQAFRRIQELYAGGSVIAGTSAGAAVMSRVMLTGEEHRQAGEPESTPFASIRKGRVITAEGFGFVDRYVIDQHFVIRQRENRLLSVVLDHPELIGVGIDESTGILVAPDQSFEVVGDASVLVVDARLAREVKADARQNYAARDITVHLLTAGEHFTP